MRERAPKRISPEEAVAEGEKALALAASEGMSKEDKLELREILRSKGVPESSLKKLFPDLTYPE
ncbi:MAG: hypothetical protein ACE5JJ_02585 [Nitrospinota bacterium]